MDIYSKAAKGISVLFILKIASRVVDYILNVLVIRNINPEILGNYF
jgi:hypothetical protein